MTVRSIMIPPSVNIGPFSYIVNIQNQVYDDRNEKMFGSVNHADLAICISDEAHLQQQAETFIHEVLHAIDYVHDVGLKEQQVHRLSMGLASLFNEIGWPSDLERKAK